MTAVRKPVALAVSLYEDKDIATRIENQGRNIDDEVALWEMNHSNLKATHTFRDDKKMRPVERTVSASVRNNAFVYTFPAHSLTILRVRLK
jgi:alpha-L-arabinofuranosidase